MEKLKIKQCKYCKTYKNLKIDRGYIQNLCISCYNIYRTKYMKECEHCKKNLTVNGYNYHIKNNICLKI